MTIPPAERRSGSRLLVVVTGSMSAATMPVTLTVLRHERPDLDIQVVATRSALRFVTITALSGAVRSDPLVDEWPDQSAEARHVVWAEWADAILVLPATLSFVARFATGMADSPALLAAQCTDRPVVLAPALPPGGLQSAAYELHWTALARRPHVAIAPPRPGPSVTTGRDDAWIPAPLDEVLDLLVDCTQRRSHRPDLHDAAVAG